MAGMQMGDFSPKVMAAIMYAILTLLAFSVYPMLLGAGNTIHLNTENACVVNGIRFDRVLLAKSSNDSVTADNGDWSNGISINGAAGKCQYQSNSIANKFSGGDDLLGAAGNLPAGYRIILPTGESYNGGILALVSSSPVATEIVWEDSVTSEWKAPEGMFTDNATLVDVVIGALALLIGVSPMTVLGMIGYYILNKFDMEQGTIATIIMVVLGAVICVSLLSTFITFISTAYDAIDADRFSVFNSGLANLAVVIKQFWGVVLIVSFFGLGALLFKTWRDNKNGNGSGDMAESRVLS